jgi:hypothetical protein
VDLGRERCVGELLKRHPTCEMCPANDLIASHRKSPSHPPHYFFTAALNELADSQHEHSRRMVCATLRPDTSQHAQSITSVQLDGMRSQVPVDRQPRARQCRSKTMEHVFLDHVQSLPWSPRFWLKEQTARTDCRSHSSTHELLRIL